MSEPFRPQEIVTEYSQTMIRIKARQVVRNPGLSPSDEPDVEQDLVVHLLSQAHRFDPTRASLNTFIARVVNSGVAMLLRKRGRAKRNPANEVELQSLSELVPQPDGYAALRTDPEAVAKWKAQVYRQSKCRLYVESEPGLARAIARISRLPVLAQLLEGCFND